MNKRFSLLTFEVTTAGDGMEAYTLHVFDRENPRSIIEVSRQLPRPDATDAADAAMVRALRVRRLFRQAFTE